MIITMRTMWSAWMASPPPLPLETTAQSPSRIINKRTTCPVWILTIQRLLTNEVCVSVWTDNFRAAFNFTRRSHIKKKLVKTLKELSETERQRLLDSDDFLSFFTRNTRILEKALEQDDIFFEYGAGDKNKEYDIVYTLSINQKNLIFLYLFWKSCGNGSSTKIGPRI